MGKEMKSFASTETTKMMWKMEGFRFGTPSIAAVEVAASTEKTVTLTNGRREHKMTDWHAWFDSEPEAIQHALQVLTSKRDYEQGSLDRAQSNLDDFKTKYGLAS